MLATTAYRRSSSHPLDRSGDLSALARARAALRPTAGDVRRRAGHWMGVTLSLAGLPVGVQVACYLLIYTFFDYWAHRLDHSPLFWPLHRYHHSAQEFCILTSDRVHPANFSSQLALYLPLSLIA